MPVVPRTNTLARKAMPSKRDLCAFLSIAMPTSTSPAPALQLGGRYEARQNEDGTIDIFDVPIVGELEKGEREDLPDFSIDEEWLQAALGRAQERAKEGYIPPLHIRHHGADAIAARAGMFMPTRLGDFTLGGKPTKTLFANLLRLTKETAAKVMKGELPYCSVEVLNTNRSPEIDSLALLDSEPPQFRYPLITVGRMTKAPGTAQPVAMRAARAGTQAVAFVDLPDLHASRALFRYARAKTPKEGVQMSADASPPADDMPPWAAKFAQMITEGMDASLARHFQAAKDANKSDLPADLTAAGNGADDAKVEINTDEDPEPEVEVDLAAKKDDEDALDAAGEKKDEMDLAAEPKPKLPAQSNAADCEPAVPRFVDPTLGEKDARLAAKIFNAVEKKFSGQRMADRGEIAGLKARLAKRDKDDAAKGRFDKALVELRGINLDEDTEKDLRAAAASSQEDTNRFVALAKRAFGRDPGRFDDLVSDITDDPPEVAAFAAKGTESLAQARQCAKHFEVNRSKGLIKMSLARYLECNVATTVETRPAVRLASSRN